MVLQGQNYNLNNALSGSTVNTCSGNFYDSGGNGGAYNNNQNLSVTFCPDVPGQTITLNFSVLNVENGYDNLYIYDGPSTGSPLINSYSGNVGALIVSSSFGCITIRFTSDGSITLAGWAAVISCSPAPPCSGTNPVCPSGFPDNCAIACPLALSTPVNCNTPASNVFCLDNSSATINTSSPPLMCGPNTVSFAEPFDAWYSFSASAINTSINLFGLDDAALTLYTGSSCGNLIPLECSAYSPVLYLNASSLNPGQTYYLQVSSYDPSLLGSYTLIISSSTVCNPCQEEAELQVSPLPVNGLYQPGTTVDFCFELEDWNTVQTNWFHGMGMELGNGWDLSSIVVNSLPGSCDGDGTWMFVNSVTGTGNGITAGPGFFYDSNQGGPLDGNPENNWGDFCNPANQGWEFCWSITTLDCAGVGNAGSTAISISTYGDGQTGSWGNFECDTDPVYSVYSVLDCCEPPVLTSTTDASCGLCNGSFVVTAMGIAPFSYTVNNASGALVTSGSGANPMINITALCANQIYTIQVLDALGCTSSLQVSLTTTTAPTAAISGGGNICAGQNLNLPITLTGTGPWNLVYALNGTPQAALVITSSPYNLNVSALGNYTLVSVSNASCIGAVSGTASVTLLASDTAAISGGGNICAGQNLNLPITLTGTGPWNLVYALNGSPQAALVITSSPYNLNVNAAGNYTLVSVSNASCNGTISGSAIVTQSLPITSTISGNLSLCSGSSETLNIANTGTPPWNIIYALNGIPQPAISTSNANYPLSVSQAGDYTLVSISNATCSGIVSGTATLTILTAPAVSAITEACNGFDYTVSFTISGGDAASYTVTGAGTLSGNQFTSNSIISGTPYSFTVTDANECDPAVISGSYDCVCPATASISGGGSLCPGETGSINVTLAGNSPWTLVYALNGTPQTPINIASSPYVINGVSPGSYSLVSVSDQDCMGSISGLAEFNSLIAPTGTLTGGGDACPGESVAFLISLTGLAPWTFVYDIDGVVQTGVNTSALAYVLNGTTPGDYTLIDIIDAACNGTVSGVATMSNIPIPNAEMSGNIEICPGETAIIDVDFTGAAPFVFNYSIDGIDQGAFISNDPIFSIESNSPGLYTLTSMSDENCNGNVNGSGIITLYDAPTAITSGSYQLCQGETASMNIALTGDGPWELSYSLNGIPAPSIIALSSPYTWNINQDGSYELLTVTDAHCDGSASGTVDLQLNAPPTLSLPTEQSFCVGESISWEMELTGTGPWDLEILLDGLAWQNIQSVSNVISFETDFDGEISVVSLTDSYCQVTDAGAFDINSNVLPTATIQGDNLICEGSPGQIEVILTGSAPFYFEYSINGIAQGIVNSASDSYSFPFSQAGLLDISQIYDQYCQGIPGSSFNVLLQSLPTATITGDFLLCQGIDTIFLVELSGAGPFDLSYSLNGINQGTINSSSNSIEISASNPGNYTLDSIIDSYCPGVVDGEAQLLYYPDIINDLADTSFCIGSIIDLIPIISGGQGAEYQLEWSGGGINSNAPSITISPDVNTVYTLIVQDDCEIEYTSTVAINVTTRPLLSANILGGQICGPGLVTVQETSEQVNENGYCYWYAQGDTVFDCSAAQFMLSGTGLIDLGFYAEPSEGCFTDTLFEGFIEIREVPDADFIFNPEDPNSAENVVQFIDQSSDADSYEWLLEGIPFSTEPHPSLALPYSEEPEFWIICQVVVNDVQCADTLCTIIKVDNELLLYVPSAFTPDNDGVNDLFFPVFNGTDPEDFSFSIFDRWGNMIWKSIDPDARWDGSSLQNGAYYAPDGVYTWRAQVKRKGTTDEKVYSGVITLLR